MNLSDSSLKKRYANKGSYYYMLVVVVTDWPMHLVKGIVIIYLIFTHVRTSIVVQTNISTFNTQQQFALPATGNKCS